MTIRSEYAANVLLASTPAPTAWMKPSSCVRKYKSWLARLLGR